MPTTTNDKTATPVTGIRRLPPLPAELLAMSREQLLARLTQLFVENLDLHVHSCGQTASYVSDNDLRIMIRNIEDLLSRRTARQ